MTYYFYNADEMIKLKVWSKAAPIQGYDSNLWRRDVYGHAIRYDLHGKQVEYGWEIDHVKPKAKGGSDELSNLQPLYWETNRKKGDTYPYVA